MESVAVETNRGSLATRPHTRPSKSPLGENWCGRMPVEHLRQIERLLLSISRFFFATFLDKPPVQRPSVPGLATYRTPFEQSDAKRNMFEASHGRATATIVRFGNRE